MASDCSGLQCLAILRIDLIYTVYFGGGGGGRACSSVLFSSLPPVGVRLKYVLIVI